MHTLRCCRLVSAFQANCLQWNVRGHQVLTAAFVCHTDAGRSVCWMKCSGDLWRRKALSNAPLLLPFHSMEMMNDHKIGLNNTREIAFYLRCTYLSPAVVNLSSLDPVRRQRRRVQPPPSIPRPWAKVLTSKSLVSFCSLFPQKSLFLPSRMAHWQGERRARKGVWMMRRLKEMLNLAAQTCRRRAQSGW